jgi:hypothetical protein
MRSGGSAERNFKALSCTPRRARALCASRQPRELGSAACISGRRSQTPERRVKPPGEEAGSSLDKLVSVTVVLADEDDSAGMNEEWLQWFPSNPPARQGAKLSARIPGLKVSIAAIAEA